MTILPNDIKLISFRKHMRRPLTTTILNKCVLGIIYYVHDRIYALSEMEEEDRKVDMYITKI